MKKIGAFSLAIFIFVLSVFSVIPVDVYADDDKTVLSFTFKQLNHSVGAGMSASDAAAVVTAHKDIYTSDGTLLFIYNPSNSYNWTTSTAAYYVTLNYSDEQLKNILMSKNPLMTLFSVSQALANNNGIRAFCAGLGTIFSGNSDMGTKVLDTLTGNYNYLDSLNYDEDSQTITMSNDNGSVDKLRQEIQDYYYKSLGVCLIKSSGKPSDGVYQIRSTYDDQDEYNHDLSAANDFDYAFFTSTTDVSDAYTLAMFNKKDISYLYAQIDTSSYFSHCYSLMFSDDGVSSFYLFSKMKYFYNYYNTADLGDYYSNYYYTQDSFVGYGIDMRNLPYISSIYPCYIKGKDYANNPTATRIYKLYRHADYFASAFYSKDGSPLVVFKSQSALYNYIQGDQNAYLTKTINDTGKDISYSIKNMDENLGSKLDTLIDTINEDKKSMSADELQNAIDKGLEDLNKNTEDIKDNTSSILDKLEEQNQILLQILGVTEFIAYQEVKENSDQYNMSYLKTLLDSMFTGLFNALMYGENTVDDNNTDTASMQSFSVSNAAAPVAVYSDDIALYYSSGSGGGSSFGGGSDSSGGHFFDLKNGLFGKFPFSIPYQCYNWLQILQRDPEAPTFTLDYGYLFGSAGAPEYVLTFDLSRYNDIAEVGRSFCRLFMTLMLALGIYHKNKGEM